MAAPPPGARVDFELCFPWGTGMMYKLLTAIRPRLRDAPALEAMRDHGEDISVICELLRAQSKEKKCADNFLLPWVSYGGPNEFAKRLEAGTHLGALQVTPSGEMMDVEDTLEV